LAKASIPFHGRRFADVWQRMRDPRQDVVMHRRSFDTTHVRMEPRFMRLSGCVRSVAAASTLLCAFVASSCATGSTAERVALGPPPQLRYETVRSMLEDSKGNFWFGSWNEGVCRYDGARLTYFAAKDGLADDQVRAIREDRHGIVWFECATGLTGFDGTRLFAPTSRVVSASSPWQLREDDLWFKEDGSMGATDVEARPGAYRHDGATFTYLTYPVVPALAERSAYATTCIAKGKSGRVWFATYAAVIGYDGKTFTVLDDAACGLDATRGTLHVRAVFEDSAGRVWIGNNGIGVLLYENGRVTHFTEAMQLSRMGMHGDRALPLPSDAPLGAPSMHRVFSIGEGREGHMWFGTVEMGAWRYDGNAMRQFTAADGLTTKDVMGIYTDRRGDLWLAGNGVFRFDGVKFERRF
jgi:ligand-binding sensor domain-containing protein